MTVIEAIAAERERQRTFWSESHDKTHTRHEWLTLITKQLGQAAQFAWEDTILETGLSRPLFVHELIQVGALVCAALEALPEIQP